MLRVLRNGGAGSRALGAASRSVTRGKASTTKLSPAVRVFPKGRMGLYDPALEKDSCGVGLCVQLKSKASRAIVVDANEMLVSRC